MHCELCDQNGGELLWQDARCRIVLVDDLDYSGFCRVIWQSHVREMTDLSSEDRAHFMFVVLAVEETLRELMKPDKINLASLGNMTPHLHWHVIPRFVDDKHFPAPIWGLAKREITDRAITNGLAEKLHDALLARLILSQMSS
jgi:diadenosine tetraphosphate (Ap4A) HIT family hydrolase